MIGAGGAGKSMLARALGAATDLPVVHLDRMYWRPGWVEPPKAEFEAALASVLAEPRWIVDGNYAKYARAPGARMRRDRVAYLDLPRVVCLACAIERHV